MQEEVDVQKVIRVMLVEDHDDFRRLVAALLDREPDPSEQVIREAISGQICRCTGYATIVRSVQWAAAHPAAAPTEQEVVS